MAGLTRYFGEGNPALQGRSLGRPLRAASVRNSAGAGDLDLTRLPSHTGSRPQTCAVNCAFCCSAATRRCNSASSASPSSAIFRVSLATFRRICVRLCSGRVPTPDFRFIGAFLFFGRFLLSSLGGCCRVTASGLRDDLEPSGKTWRLSGGSVFFAVPEEEEVRDLGSRRFLEQSPAGERMR